MNEVWKAVPGYEGLYEASTFGRLRSLDRTITQMGRWGELIEYRYRGRVLAVCENSNGYTAARLYRDGVQWATATHIVIALTFLGPRPQGKEVTHRDGIRSHNELSNLKYGTKLENEADKERHGTRLKGETSPTAKLSVMDVIAIRRRIGEPQQDLADEFGCTFSNISAIQLRKSWRHV